MTDGTVTEGSDSDGVVTDGTVTEGSEAAGNVLTAGAVIEGGPTLGTGPEGATASTVFADMWLDPDSDPREGGPAPVDERTTLLEYLRSYRLTLSMKCADLDAEQLARRSVPPSTMWLLGLVRHMAEVERHWFRRVMGGEEASFAGPCGGPGRRLDWSCARSRRGRRSLGSLG